MTTTEIAKELQALERELAAGVPGRFAAPLLEDYEPDIADTVEAAGMVRWALGEFQAGRLGTVSRTWVWRARRVLAHYAGVGGGKEKP